MGGNLPGAGVAFPHVTEIITVERDGSLIRRTEQMTLIEKTTIPQILQVIKAWMEDPAAWEAIQKDR
jgi:hypothetical protein